MKGVFTELMVELITRFIPTSLISSFVKSFNQLSVAITN